jgi:hypothetical protein
MLVENAMPSPVRRPNRKSLAGLRRLIPMGSLYRAVRRSGALAWESDVDASRSARTRAPLRGGRERTG